jgi:hypothetical protein
VVASERKERGAVRLIMARVTDETRHLRLPSLRVQPSGRNGYGSGETGILDVPPGLSRRCLKPDSCKNAAPVGNQTAHFKT